MARRKEGEFVEFSYLFDNINAAKAVMPELDKISSDILTGVSAVGRADGRTIVNCCLKQGHDEITEQVRKILSLKGIPLSLTSVEIVENALAGRYTVACLGNATAMLPLM